MGARKKNKQPRGGVAPSWRKANIQVHKEHRHQLGEEWQRIRELIRRGADELVHRVDRLLDSLVERRLHRLDLTTDSDANGVYRLADLADRARRLLKYLV